jgi:hypothetical protein
MAILRVREIVLNRQQEVDMPVDLGDNTEVESATAPGETCFDNVESAADDEDDQRLAEALARSEAQFARGEGIPAEEVLARLRARRGG